ncbi:acyl-CoA-binding domain-containing protein 4 [Haplosporangium sp. Z 767]|nr:acyl-CoA-binding domain-containing protein 4 [Haplosporangium sp. Z 767]KAF9195421.1 acyl-CoA-binding domain-containing protein 4 [Haplosporangium sp. Z 11]
MTNTWRVLDTTGPAPSEREDPCMTIDQENTKLVIFGGQDENSVFGDIHVLDLITMEWTVGPPASEGRIAMACAQYEDGFLAWGGAKDKFLMARHNTQPVVFNLTTMQWTTQYKMSSTLISPTPDTSTGKNTTVFALSLGVTMMIVALIAIAIGVCLYRREKRKAVRNYSKVSGKPGAPILKEGSRGTLSSDLAIPNPLHQRHRDRITAGYGDGSRHDSEMDDYDEDINDQEDASAHTSIDRKRRRRSKVSNIGHKIELSSMEPIAMTSAVAGDKEEDLSFVAPSQIRPKAAPPIPHSQIPLTNCHNSVAVLQTQASAPSPPT